MSTSRYKSGFTEKLLFLGFSLVITFLIGINTFNKSTQKSEAAVTIPAFPGAEGFGSKTIGGRLGKIIEVTNLNDSGPGSFRQAVVAETGPRIVVFKVGGVVNLKSDIEINNPFLTVAGQTAPGDGIVLSGARLAVRAHDVIIRGLKVRPGDGPGGNIDTRDGIAVSTNPNTKAEVYNVIIDHNSISWGIDENVSIWDNTHGMEGTKLHDVTYSWNIVSEALRCVYYPNTQLPNYNCSKSGSAPYDRVVHGFGPLIGESVKNISFHHNLVASHDFRNPAITQGVSLEFINNVVYNYGLASMSITSGGNSVGPDDPVAIDIIGNYFKSTSGSLHKTMYGVANQTIKGVEITCSIPPNSKVYVNNNIDSKYRTSDSQDQWDAVYLYESCPAKNLAAVRSYSRLLPVTSGVTTTTAGTAYLQVLEYAGTRSQGLDEVDARAVSTTRNGTSPVARQIINAPGNRNNWFIDTPEEAGPLPIYRTIQSGIPDNDHDGMPDEWETRYGLNPNDYNDRNKLSSRGYTCVEEYINSLISPPFSSDSPLVMGDCATGVAFEPFPTGGTEPNPTGTASATPTPVDGGSPTRTPGAGPLIKMILAPRLGDCSADASNMVLDTAIGCIPVGDPQALASFFLGWGIGISGGIALILIVFSTYRIMTSAGDPKKLQAGKELLLGATSGLVFLVFAAFILDFVGVEILGIF